jgi:hypothetical protein
MKIMAGEEATREVSGSPVGQDGLRNYLAWLRAMEQAQLDERQKYQAQKKGDPAMNGGSHDEAAAGRNPGGMNADASAGIGGAVWKGKESNAPLRAGPASVESNERPSMAARSSATLVSGVAATEFLPVRAGVLKNVATAAPSPAQVFVPRGEAAQPQHVHVIAEDGGLRMWLRDPKIDAESGLKLLWSLRRELQASGLHLASLALNGHSVEPVDKSFR